MLVLFHSTASIHPWLGLVMTRVSQYRVQSFGEMPEMNHMSHMNHTQTPGPQPEYDWLFNIEFFCAREVSE